MLFSQEMFSKETLQVLLSHDFCNDERVRLLPYEIKACNLLPQAQGKRALFGNTSQTSDDKGFCQGGFGVILLKAEEGHHDAGSRRCRQAADDFANATLPHITDIDILVAYGEHDKRISLFQQVCSFAEGVKIFFV